MIIAYNNQLQGMTTLFLTHSKNKVTTPKVITWEQVNLTGERDLQDAQPSIPLISDDLETINQYPDGKVEIRLNNVRSTVPRPVTRHST